MRLATATIQRPVDEFEILHFRSDSWDVWNKTRQRFHKKDLPTEAAARIVIAIEKGIQRRRGMA